MLIITDFRSHKHDNNHGFFFQKRANNHGLSFAGGGNNHVLTFRDLQSRTCDHGLAITDLRSRTLFAEQWDFRANNHRSVILVSRGKQKTD